MHIITRTSRTERSSSLTLLVFWIWLLLPSVTWGQGGYDVDEVERREQQRRLDAEHAKEAAATIGDVAKSVEQLPTATTADKLKKAVLEWALEDARASLDAGLGTSAKEVLADVQASLSKDLGQRHDPPAELLPAIRQSWKNWTACCGGSWRQGKADLNNQINPMKS